MKHSAHVIFIIVLFFLCSCTCFDAKQSGSEPAVPSSGLAVPVGKNWQLIEEAPKLSDERGRLPFQTEQSLQPDVARPVPPGEIRMNKTPL